MDCRETMADTNEVCFLDIYLLFIIALMCVKLKIHGKGFNENFVSRSCTSCINGVFALIIFYSHLAAYIYIDMETGGHMHAIRDFLGQLMVASFLFYSGYGVYEQIKKRPAYVDSIPGKRVAKVWVRMAFTVCLFAVMQRMLGYGVSRKAFLMYLGNSNWYVFAVLFSYLMTYAAFTICGDNHKLSIALVFAGTAFYAMFMGKHKQLWWYDTIMCYPVGMLVSYYIEGITEKLFKTKSYLLGLVCVLLAFLITKQCRANWAGWNLYSVLFALLVMLVSVKIELRSPVLNWFGRNAFWMYELQRIPMIVLRKRGYAERHSYKTAAISFAVTVIGAFLCEKLFAQVDRLLFGGRKKKAQTTQS